MQPAMNQKTALATMLARLGLALFLGAVFAGGVAFACEDETVEIQTSSGKFAFSASFMDDDLGRAKGLMFVESMPTFEGMLFIYDKPMHAAFWMKNTLIPLDMIFADPTGEITHIHHNAVPHSEETIDGGENVLYVLEINGGLAKKFDFDVGDAMRHNQIDPEIAVWKCEN